MTTTAPIDPPAERSAGSDPRQLVVFCLGSAEYAVRISCVQEIIRYLPPRPMPGGAPGVEGVINLRGRIIPVIDLRRILGSDGVRPDDAKIVIVDVGDATLGMEVDEVSEVLTVGATDCEPAPPSMDDGTGTGVIQAVVKLEGRLLVELDLDRLLGAHTAY